MLHATEFDSDLPNNNTHISSCRFSFTCILWNKIYLLHKSKIKMCHKLEMGATPAIKGKTRDVHTGDKAN